MTKNKRDRILKITEKIIKKINSLGYATPADACEIVEMLDKLEDYLMDYKAYDTKFKKDIRYLRYLAMSIVSTGPDTQKYYKKRTIGVIEILGNKLDIWTTKEMEVEWWNWVKMKLFHTVEKWRKDERILWWIKGASIGRC